MLSILVYDWLRNFYKTWYPFRAETDNRVAGPLRKNRWWYSIQKKFIFYWVTPPMLALRCRNAVMCFGPYTSYLLALPLPQYLALITNFSLLSHLYVWWLFYQVSEVTAPPRLHVAAGWNTLLLTCRFVVRTSLISKWVSDSYWEMEQGLLIWTWAGIGIQRQLLLYTILFEYTRGDPVVSRS